MEATLLLSCSIKVLTLLIRQYEEGNIPAEEFEKNCRLKIEFILEHIDHISCEREKELASEVMKKYFNITANFHTPLSDYKTGQ
jgi:hypothetical protein